MAPALDRYYFIKDVKKFYRKSHGCINSRKKVRVKEGNFQGI